MALQPWLISWVAVCIFYVIASTACQSDLDCELNGICDENHQCQCNSLWTGVDCSSLALQPLDASWYSQQGPISGYHDANSSTWGASVLSIQESEHRRTYYMLVSEMVNQCGLDTWETNSHIILAKSDHAMGPYEFVEETIGIYHHNPTILYHPEDKLYLLYVIGADRRRECAFDCRAGIKTEPNDTSQCLLRESAASANVSVYYSDTVHGPWKTITSILPGAHEYWNQKLTNPAPMLLRDGGVLLAFRGVGEDEQDERIGLAYAKSWRGPYSILSRDPLFPDDVLDEDPFLWQDENGNYHMLAHKFVDWNRADVGAHAYSADGIYWHHSSKVAYNTLVSYNDDNVQAFRAHRRERPHLLFLNANEQRLYQANAILFTGVVPDPNSDRAFTMAQPVGSYSIQTVTTENSETFRLPLLNLDAAKG